MITEWMRIVNRNREIADDGRKRRESKKPLHEGSVHIVDGVEFTGDLPTWMREGKDPPNKKKDDN